MKGYFAFPPHTTTAAAAITVTDTPPQPSSVQVTGVCTIRTDCLAGGANVPQAMEGARQKRQERERALGERSEIEWVRAGGVLRDALGRRDKARTEQIRRELNLQEVEKQKMARWEAYEARWRAVQLSAAPILFIEFPWPLAERVACRDLSPLTRRAVSDFLFESLALRSNTMTKRDKIRTALLRWHPDKISFLLPRVVSDDLELVREGIHVVFRILKALQDAERTGVL